MIDSEMVAQYVLQDFKKRQELFIYCATKEERDELFDVLHSLGFTWNSGASLMEYRSFYDDSGETIMFGDYGIRRGVGHRDVAIPCSDFDKSFTVTDEDIISLLESEETG